MAMAGAILVSWVAVSQPASHAVPAPVPLGPARLLSNALRPGIIPAPEGAPGPYLLQRGRVSALFRETGMALRLPSQTRPVRELEWRVAGARAVRPQAEKPREAPFFQRAAPEVSSYGGLRYPGVRPGVDLWFEERAEGVEYGFRAERGADLRRVELEYEGARAVRVVDEGRALEVDLEEGVLREEGLWCAQESPGGVSREVECRFTDARQVGRERWAYVIEVDVEEPERPVVVDPVIQWNTYLGGSLADDFGGMVVTDAGMVLVAGTVEIDPSLLACNCIDGLEIEGKGVIVAGFHEGGGFAGWRILNGSGVDVGRSITLGKDGMVYVAGETTSKSFGTFPSNKGAGLGDGFVAQLDVSNPAAWRFRWIYLVGSPSGNEAIHAISTGADGGLFVVGETTSQDFPGAPDASTDGGRDAFVTRLHPATAPDGSVATTLEWSTLGRGTHDDVLYAVTVDEGGRVYVTGRSASPGLLPGALRTHAGPAGTDDVLVARLNPATGGVDRSLYLGGLGNDEGRALALKGAGDANLFVAGTTRSAGFPLQTGSAAVSDAFVVTLDRDSFALKAVRVVGGSMADDEGLALAVDRSPAAAGRDIVYLGGKTASPGDFPLEQPFDRNYGGSTEGFVARLEVDAGAPLSWSSLVGGGGEDVVLALNSERPGRLFLGGTTSSDDLVPLGTPGYSKTPKGGTELFLMSVEQDASTPEPGTDAGVDAGTDAGVDAGVDAGTDVGVDAGTDGGMSVPTSPLGWSCGVSGRSGGPGALAFGTLAGLALLARRRKREAHHG
ncbi:hypothetical protein Q664_50915 [Archangium violaceum Cb vi76]|uniref:DUF7948 domain-containing protein n=1 Tax=Archangium violaceum Cb vi76 TaxID=1406225 RepID=A0A084SEU8_9BACT|nr:hypothetical protein Q664_50915 [Archangium violaceum Cb vi76]